ncbi:hypothetical protein ACOMHN_030341 [Nucella lapillus]
MDSSVFALPTKPKVGFLSSFIPRHILPFGVPHNRLGRKDGVFPRGRSALGPGSYDIEKSFGGTPILMPAATKQSSISRNTVKLCTSSVEQKHNRKLAYLKLYY